MYLPGGLRYSGVALGFNNQLIGIGATVQGPIVPWRTRHPIWSASILYDKVSGASSSVNLQIAGFDFDGVTGIGGFTSFLNTVPDDAFAYVVHGAITASGGTTVAAGAQIILDAPYARFRVINNDALNTVNVTLQIILNL